MEGSSSTGSSAIGATQIPPRSLVTVGTLHCRPASHCYHELINIRRFARFAAWIGLALIIFVTISPIDARPSDVTTTDLDRALAFVVMSGLFIIAYPKRALAVCLVLLIAAFSTELAQLASVTRHPHIHDAVVKAFGVLVGVGASSLFNLVVSKTVRSLN
jgi:hypothetical protein